MADIYSISHVTYYLRDLIESDPFLSDLWVRGEISNWTQARSGHCYFTLKDGGAELRCVMWRTAAARLPTLPRDGDEIVAGGNLAVYAERGSYQFYVAEMQPVGLGALFRRFEALKAALAAEGLFAPERKLPLPVMPRRVGIVTSPTAAALQDILNVLRRRHPLVQVFLSPTAVQGSEAPGGIVRALRRFDRVSVDLIIVARGGGSIEDLWAFNEEAVARAIYRCTTPIISGVGHEVDFTIADFVADHRAPTPSAAAELAVPDIRELRERLRDLRIALGDIMQGELRQRRQSLFQEARALERLAPENRVRENRQRVDHLQARLDRALTTRLQLEQSHLAGTQGRLRNLDPRATLARGYAVVADARTGRLVRHTSDVQPGQPLTVTVRGGTFGVTTNDSSAKPGRRGNQPERGRP